MKGAGLTVKIKLSISGMSCAHCVMHVENALRNVQGVKDAKADLKTNTAVAELTAKVSPEKLKQAIEDEGYAVTKIEKIDAAG